MKLNGVKVSVIVVILGLLVLHNQAVGKLSLQTLNTLEDL